MRDFTPRRHTWRGNWVNCAVLTGNSAGLRAVISSRLSHRELSSSLRKSNSFLCLPVFIHHSHTHKETHGTDKPNGKLVLCQRTFSSVFRAVFFFFTQTTQFNLGFMVPFTNWRILVLISVTEGVVICKAVSYFQWLNTVVRKLKYKGVKTWYVKMWRPSRRMF